MAINLSTKNIENLILTIRNTSVIIDSDVAKIYGVETKRIIEAVKNNPDKFPKGFILELSKNELEDLRTNFSSTKLSKTRVLPKAFTEQGLYMLATILKSKKATSTTLLIINTFTKIRDLQKNFNEMLKEKDENKKNSIGAKFGKELIDIFLNDDLESKESESKIKFSMFGMSLEKIVKKSKK